MCEPPDVKTHTSPDADHLYLAQRCFAEILFFLRNFIAKEGLSHCATRVQYRASIHLRGTSTTRVSRLRTVNRIGVGTSACDAKSEEHRRRRQEVKSARSGQSTTYMFIQFWTHTVTFSRWSPRSRRPVLGRAACRRQAANLRVVCSLPSLRKREVTCSEPQNRGEQALSRCCTAHPARPSLGQRELPPMPPGPHWLAVGVRCRAPRVRASLRRRSAANGCRRPSALLPRSAAATARPGAP